MQILAYLISPLHCIAAVAAARAIGGEGQVRITCAVHWPGADAARAGELGDIIGRMTADMPEVASVRIVTSDALTAIVGRADVDAAAAELRDLCGGAAFDAIFYSHDVVGEFYRALAAAYPQARRVCYGDGLGIVYEREHHLSFLTRKASGQPAEGGTRRAATLRRLARRLFGRRTSEDGPAAQETPVGDDRGFGRAPAQPHAAALILPVDQSGRFLGDMPLTVVPREIARAVVDRAAASCTALRDHVEDLLAACGDRRRYLLLTENSAEGGFMTFVRDVEMYCATIRAACPAGSAVILKSHPGETLPRNEAIRERLGQDYTLVAFDPRFKRYPIELAPRLVGACTPICMSYPALSLKYLYDVDVIQPMDDAFIERWYPERVWDSYKNAITLYERPLARLPGWDGRSLLWSGAWEA